MSNFTSPLILEDTGKKDDSGRTLYRTTRELEYELGSLGSGLKIVVPEGRITNLATVPTTPILSYLFRDITTINGKYIAAPVLHDYLCNEQFPGFKEQCSGFSRFEADVILRSALEALLAPYWQTLSVYYAVRIYAIVTGKR